MSVEKQAKENLKKALAGELKEPHLAELAMHFFHLIGGPRKFAKLLVDEYNGSKSGSLVRSQILNMILRTTKFANEQSGNASDMSLLSQDDLDKQLRECLLEFPGIQEIQSGD